MLAKGRVSRQMERRAKLAGQLSPQPAPTESGMMWRVRNRFGNPLRLSESLARPVSSIYFILDGRAPYSIPVSTLYPSYTLTDEDWAKEFCWLIQMSR